MLSFEPKNWVVSHRAFMDQTMGNKIQLGHQKSIVLSRCQGKALKTKGCKRRKKELQRLTGRNSSNKKTMGQSKRPRRYFATFKPKYNWFINKGSKRTLCHAGQKEKPTTPKKIQPPTDFAGPSKNLASSMSHKKKVEQMCI